MIKIILLALMAVFMVSCKTTQTTQTVVIPAGITGETERKVKVQEKAKIPVRLTVYWSKGGGSDYWTRRCQSAFGEKLSEGVSVAADPRLFPYGKVVYIDGVGVRKVIDTGTRVVDRTAAKQGAKMLLRKREIGHDEYEELRDAPVIDLYFERRETALLFASMHPMFTEMAVID